MQVKTLVFDTNSSEDEYLAPSNDYNAMFNFVNANSKNQGCFAIDSEIAMMKKEFNADVETFNKLNNILYKIIAKYNEETGSNTFDMSVICDYPQKPEVALRVEELGDLFLTYLDNECKKFSLPVGNYNSFWFAEMNCMQEERPLFVNTDDLKMLEKEEDILFKNITDSIKADAGYQL